ncbi:hypothetical protein [Haloarchaeobius amylolyticus]|uniref:hypothetical protein n=1 Tax=Haloarchaeobius amylolyticus TaxID=1198296 RepID=UPI00226E00BE|nr:hypothetical protein [Haloarchaeobius amylolyticus]
MSIFPHSQVPTVEVFSVDDVSPAAVAAVESVYEETFGIPVTRRGALGELDRDRDDDPPRASAYLRTLAGASDADFAFAVTDRPLRLYGGDEVNGMFHDGEGVAVVTIDQLVDGDEFDADARVAFERLVRQFAGGLFGFQSHEDCVMASTEADRGLADIPDDFCDDCAKRLRGEDTAPEPDEWHVTTKELEEFETAMRWADGDIRLTEYPLIALGIAYNTVEDIGARLPSIGSRALPRSVRASIHKTYRSVRFVVNAVLFLVLAGATFVLLLDGYGALTGSEASTAVAFGGLVVAVVLGIVEHAIVTGIVGGLFQGFAEGAREGLGAEE